MAPSTRTLDPALSLFTDRAGEFGSGVGEIISRAHDPQAVHGDANLPIGRGEVGTLIPEAGIDEGDPRGAGDGGVGEYLVQVGGIERRGLPLRIEDDSRSALVAKDEIRLEFYRTDGEFRLRFHAPPGARFKRPSNRDREVPL